MSTRERARDLKPQHGACGAPGRQRDPSSGELSGFRKEENTPGGRGSSVDRTSASSQRWDSRAGRGGQTVRHLETDVSQQGRGLGTPGCRDGTWLHHCQILDPRTAPGTQLGFTKHLQGV